MNKPHDDEVSPIIDELDTYEIAKKGGTVIVHGRRFLPADKVFIDDKAYTTRFMSTIRLEVEVKKSNNMKPATYGLSVGNTKDRRSNMVMLVVSDDAGGK